MQPPYVRSVCPLHRVCGKVAMATEPRPLPGDAATAPPSSPDCLHCGVCVSRDGQAPHPRELPWLHVCHVLLRCSAPSQKPRALALLAFHNDLSETHNCLRYINADGLHLSADALGTESSETWDAAVSALLPQLAACLNDAHFSPDDELALHRRLLSILLHPADWASLPASQGDAFVQSVARFLRGEPHPHAASIWSSEFGLAAGSDMCEDCDGVRVRIAQLDDNQARDSLGAGCSRVQETAKKVARQMTSSSGARPRTVRRGGGCSRAAGRLRGHPRAPEMGSGDPEVLPSGLHHRCASVDPGSASEDEVELPVVSESGVPFSCGAPRPMLDPG